MHCIEHSRACIAAALIVVSFASIGCARSENAKVDTTTPRESVSAGSVGTSPDTLALIRGTIASVSANQLSVTTDSGTKTVSLSQPVKVYDREPATMSRVTDNVFVGVTTVKQPDGSERATEIHIFPEELRGLGEGSRPMAPAGGNATTTNRMTNGAVSGPQMTNGTAQPRMSNGSVANSAAGTMVVQYAGGSVTVAVPSNVKVTEIKAVSKPLAAGEKVVVVAKRGADGSISSNRVMLTAK